MVSEKRCQEPGVFNAAQSREPKTGVFNAAPEQRANSAAAAPLAD